MKALKNNLVKLIARTSQTFLVGLVGVISLSLAGCQSVASEPMKSALLDTSNEATQAKIKQIISQEFGAADLRLAEKIFVNESSVTIMRQALQTIDNRNIQGRDMQQPVRFKLMKRGSNCYLVLDSSSKSWDLEDVSCRYE